MADYEGVANLEVMRLARNYNHHLCELVNRHDPGSGLVVDFGSGLGTFSGCTRSDRSRVLCIEPDDRFRSALEAAGYQTASAISDIPEEAATYIFSLNVLEHIADDYGTVRDLAGRIRRGGRLLLYVPAFQHLYSSMDRKVGHYRRYSRAQISVLLSGTGLSIVTARYEDFLGFFATLVFKWTDRREAGDVDARALVFYDRFLYPVSRLLSRIFGRWVGKNLLIVAERH
jgi:hypothetical protein